MARALTASEKQRYPWASRIIDYVPVGRWRKAGALCALGTLVVLVVGIGFLYVTAQSARHGVHPTHGTLGPGTLIVAGLLALAALVLGVVTGVQAIAKDAKRLLVWSVLAAVPGVAALVLYFF